MYVYFQNTFSVFYALIFVVAHLFPIQFDSVDENISLFCNPHCNSAKPGKSPVQRVLKHDIKSQCNLGFEVNHQAILQGYSQCRVSY
jgi:hypothetical protein